MAVEQLQDTPYLPNLAQPQTTEELLFWVRNELQKLSVAIQTNNAEIQGIVDGLDARLEVLEP